MPLEEVGYFIPDFESFSVSFSVSNGHRFRDTAYGSVQSNEFEVSQGSSNSSC